MLIWVPISRVEVLSEVRARGLPSNAVILPPLSPRPALPPDIRVAMVQPVAISFESGVKVEWLQMDGFSKRTWREALTVAHLLDGTAWSAMIEVMQTREHWYSIRFWCLIHGDPQTVLSTAEMSDGWDPPQDFAGHVLGAERLQQWDTFICQHFYPGNGTAANDAIHATPDRLERLASYEDWRQVGPAGALRQGVARVQFPESREEVERFAAGLRHWLPEEYVAVTDGALRVRAGGREFPVGYSLMALFFDRHDEMPETNENATDSYVQTFRDGIHLIDMKQGAIVPVIEGTPAFFDADGRTVALIDDTVLYEAGDNDGSPWRLTTPVTDRYR